VQADTTFIKNKWQIALCGGTVLEEALDLSSDRLLNEWNDAHFSKMVYEYFQTGSTNTVSQTKRKKSLMPMKTKQA